LKRSVAKQFDIGSLNQVLGCTTKHLPLQVLSYEQTYTSCLGERTPKHPSTRQCCMQKHRNRQNIRHLWHCPAKGQVLNVLIETSGPGVKLARTRWQANNDLSITISCWCVTN
jgi:hypothetical protein